MKQIYKRHLLFVVQRAMPVVLLAFLSLFFTSKASAQCPPNIDFEEGTFNHWQCGIGNFDGSFPMLVTPSLPIPGRHDMLSNPPGDGTDYYGDFSKNCPNGSGHSIRIGNQSTGREIDAVSYTITIPTGQDIYNLIYHYAIVLNDGGHPANLQPRMTIEVENLTTGNPLPCPFQPIVATSGLPGFFVSRHTGSGGTSVYCKDWAAGSLKLDNNGGNTIRITFTVTGCGLQPNGSHFGYAYIDMNSTCSSSFTGATFCPDDTSVNVTAPFGYQNYTWWDAGFSNVLGHGQTLTLNPPPLSGAVVKVIIEPYSGYGCLDTLTAELWDTLTIHPIAGRDTSVCNGNPVQLGAPPLLGLVYKWTPATGLSNPDIANPFATPALTTQYILTVTNNGGGCATKDTVVVTTPFLSDSIQLIGPASYCTASGQVTKLKVLPADAIQWYRNGVAIPGATSTIYTVTQSGLYKAELISFIGCSIFTVEKQIDIYESPVAGFTSSATSACFGGNTFTFTNTSTISSGALQYYWDLGDNTSFTTQDVTHSYLQAGTYTVKMVVTAPGGCADSQSVIITVNPGPVAGFTNNITTQCSKGHQFVFTNTSTISGGTMLYTWDMGDATIFHTRDVTYSYANPGNYTVKMLVQSSVGTCKDSATVDVVVNPSPTAGFTANQVNQCFPGHQYIFTNSSTVYSGALQYHWDLGDNTIDTTRDVTHSYAQPGTYTVKLFITAATGGCVDSSSLVVTVYPYATPDFTVNTVCQNLRLPLYNQTKDVPGTTVNYMWDFGNSQTSTDRIPVYSYSIPGTYFITLTVSTAQCPLVTLSKQAVVQIEKQEPGVTYPLVNTSSWFREKLNSRAIGNSVLWIPATSLDNRLSHTPVFYGPGDQLYTIQLRTPAGCLTVDTQFVHAGKNIRIYVPTTFTPNGDGKNDLMRPYLVSIEKVNYFRIYDRWGKLLFEMHGDRPGWDGRVNGQEVSLQTVVWVIECVDVDGVVHKQNGTTILMR